MLISNYNHYNMEKNNITMDITDKPDELGNYLKNIYSITIGILNKLCLDKNTISDIVKMAPVEKYKLLHLEDYQKKIHGNKYAPILISRDFSNIYTNTGILNFGNKFEISAEISENLINDYKLKIYNNQYYFIDSDNSFNYLESFYRKSHIEYTWKNILDIDVD